MTTGRNRLAPSFSQNHDAQANCHQKPIEILFEQALGLTGAILRSRILFTGLFE